MTSKPAIFPGPLPEWRNGRRAGLKIRWGQPRVSSTLTSGIPLHHNNLDMTRLRPVRGCFFVKRAHNVPMLLPL